MENTINTTIETTTEATKALGLTERDWRDLKWFALGIGSVMVTEIVLIPAGKKTVKWIKGKISKKPVETTAEIVEIEE